MKFSPHGPQTDLVGQVCVMGKECCEQVLRKRVHGYALSVDDLAQAAEGTAYKYLYIHTHTEETESGFNTSLR